jgi:hypothetical protein
MAALVTVRLPAALPPIERDFLRAGAPGARGRSLAVTSRYLELDGRPWLPVMGEFHYSRYPADEWEVELRKMRAGGISTTSPNKELANEFLENYLLSKDGLHAMNAHVPLGAPPTRHCSMSSSPIR